MKAISTNQDSRTQSLRSKLARKGIVICDSFEKG